MKSRFHAAAFALLIGVLAQLGAGARAQGFSFNGYNGSFPVSGMIKLNGLLYGVTELGGNGPCSSDFGRGCGVLFSYNPRTNQESVVYNFQGGADGELPYSHLIAAGGMLYGTTLQGGDDQGDACYTSFGGGCGTVFEVDPASGRETVLHRFQPYGKDGAYPIGALVMPDPNSRDALIGTTSGGGNYSEACGRGCGTIFKITLATGAEKILHVFNANQTDATSPTADLIRYGEKLYSVTMGGGTQGYGTIYALDLRTGVEAVEHSFSNQNGSGYFPAGGMTQVGGLLYGATSNGGQHSYGTIFSFDPNTSTQQIAYSFGSTSKDSIGPYIQLIHRDGILYGTSERGGTQYYGTIFSFDIATSTNKVLVNIGYGNLDPFENNKLDYFDGTLFGTVPEGGTYGNGYIYAVYP